MHKARQVFGEAAEAEYADVFILGHTCATIGPFERLRNLTYTLCARFAVSGHEHLTSMNQILLLRNLITGR